MQYLKALFSSGPYMPHGYCFCGTLAWSGCMLFLTL